MLVKQVSRLKDKLFQRLLSFRERLKLPEKWKGGRIEKLNQYCEGLYLDYKSVAVDAIEESKRKPRKAYIISSGLAILFAALKTNPDEQSFYDQHTRCVCELSMVGDPIRNPVAENHVMYISKCQNQEVLRKTDMLFFTLIWKADYSEHCDIYASQCKFLKPRFLTFHQRIVDIGLFGMWLNLYLKMQDFDINPNEWIDQT